MAVVPTLSLPGKAYPLRTPSLYVGDLHPETTEGDLEEVFSWVGPLESFRLCRDAASRKSLCYAYISFFCISHASKALACLNHTTLRGKPIRIMWWQRDPATIKSGFGNVFVKNLAPSVTSAQLERMFSKYGTILSCKVAEENGKSKCFGFVQFDTQNSAITAIKSLHGIVFEGKKLYVSTFKKKQERMVTCEEHKFTNLYVKNFDCNLTEDLLRDKFSKYGKVRTAVIMRDEEGNSRGFGFVKFDSDEDAKNAVEALNGELIGSKKLFVGRAQKKAERERLLRCVCEDKLALCHQKPEASKLYVGNLNVSINERKLEELFSTYGKVISAKIIRRDGISKGFGFVRFSSPGDAKAAMDSLNGNTCDGKPLYVALAYCNEEHLRKSLTSYAPRGPPSFFTCKDKIIPSSYKSIYHVPPCSLPMSIPHFSHSTMYQNFGRQLSTFYPAGMHNFRGGRFTYDLKKQTWHLPARHLICEYKRMKSAPSVSVPAWKLGTQKQLRTFWEPKNKNMKGAKSVSSPLSTATKELTATSVAGIHKERSGGKALPSHV